MAKKSTKEKKLRRKRNQEQEIQQLHINFDIIQLLIENPIQTKPEVGDFLKKYVKCIRLLIDYSKIAIYPTINYSISKVFIDFLDGHQIIVDFKTNPRQYFLWYKLDEITVKEKDMHRIMEFVLKLQEFSFIH